MRDESKAIASAFIRGERCKRARTETDGANVWLHGNRIAWRDPDGSIWASMCGWGSPLTRDRLNAIAWALGYRQYPFYQHDFEQYFIDRDGTPRMITSYEAVQLTGPLESRLRQIEARQRVLASA